MIVSHRHRFIFFAVPKTATHAVRQALAPHLADDDWRQEDLFEECRLPIAPLAAKKHGHLSVREVRPHLSDEIWRSYFKFAFVRNPFDRFISTCFFLCRREPDFKCSATEQMKKALGFERFRQRVLVAPQSSLLTSADGDLALDFVGRFESLQRSYDEICRRIGIPVSRLERRSVSEHNGYAQYYHRDLRKTVTELYRDYLRNFGSAFDAALPTK